MARGNPNIRNIGFGSRPREVDDEYRSRIKGVKRKRVWTKARCSEVLDDLLTHLNKILKEDEKIEKDNPKKLKQENVRDAITLINKILDVMKYLYPPVQENLNVNIDLTADAVVERLKTWKEKEQVVVVGDNKKNDKKDK